MVEQGETERAIDFLGRPYMVEGKVVEGFGRGREIGFPTINIETAFQLIPRTGVYSTEITVKGNTFRSVTNIGFNPTFEGKEMTIETFLLDFEGDLYGEDVILSFYRRVRDETKFSSVDDLKARITLDVEMTRAYFAERRGAQEEARVISCPSS